MSNIFHVSQLRKYIYDLSHVIKPNTLQLKDNLTIDTMHVQITDKKLRAKSFSSKIPLE